MGISEIMERLREKREGKKDLIKQAESQDKIQSIIEEKKMSSNERELRKFLKEDREESIKEQLEQMRRTRDIDIKFNHNPLNTPNITNHTEWQVLKEPNQFSGKSNMFQNKGCILRDNKKLLKSNMRLLG
jgi:hypothetical protein